MTLPDMRSPRWTGLERAVALVFVLFILLAAIWGAVSTSLFLRQDSMAITRSETGDWIMTSVRATPLGTFEAEWIGEYRVVGREDGMTCQASGRSNVSATEGNIVRYRIGDWALPCLEEGPPIAVTYTRRALLLGVIPLRPVRFSFTINPENAPVLPAKNDGGEP